MYFYAFLLKEHSFFMKNVEYLKKNKKLMIFCLTQLLRIDILKSRNNQKGVSY